MKKGLIEELLECEKNKTNFKIKKEDNYYIYNVTKNSFFKLNLIYHKKFNGFFFKKDFRNMCIGIQNCLMVESFKTYFVSDYQNYCYMKNSDFLESKDTTYNDLVKVINQVDYDRLKSKPTDKFSKVFEEVQIDKLIFYSQSEESRVESSEHYDLRPKKSLMRKLKAKYTLEDSCILLSEIKDDIKDFDYSEVIEYITDLEERKTTLVDDLQEEWVGYYLRDLEEVWENIIKIKL